VRERTRPVVFSPQNWRAQIPLGKQWPLSKHTHSAAAAIPSKFLRWPNKVAARTHSQGSIFYLSPPLARGIKHHHQAQLGRRPTLCVRSEFIIALSLSLQ
jgi:hypothetical protein